MARILCLGTSTRLCSVALGVDGEARAVRNETGDGFIHAERINLAIQEVLDEEGVRMSELDAVAVGIGPGSYTGLRIGLSVAKGLCYALKIPVIGVRTTGILVQALLRTTTIDPGLKLYPMLDARRMEVFVAEHAPDGSLITEPFALILDQEWVEAQTARSGIVVFGEGADKATELWSTSSKVKHVPGIIPYAEHLNTLAHDRFAQGEFDDLAYLVPAYAKSGVPKGEPPIGS